MPYGVFMSATPEHQIVISRPLTVAEFAEIFRYHPESVRRAIRQGRIKTIHVGRQHRIPAKEVERILSEGLPATAG